VFFYTFEYILHKNIFEHYVHFYVFNSISCLILYWIFWNIFLNIKISIFSYISNWVVMGLKLRRAHFKKLKRSSIVYNEFIRQYYLFEVYAVQSIYRREILKLYVSYWRKHYLDITQTIPRYLRWWVGNRFTTSILREIKLPVILFAYLTKIYASFFWILFVLGVRVIFNICIRYSHILWLIHFYFYLLIRGILWLKWIISPQFYYEIWVLFSK